MSVSVDLYVCVKELVGRLLKLMRAPWAPQVLPVCCSRARGLSTGPVPGESLLHIPFPLFQASLYER